MFFMFFYLQINVFNIYVANPQTRIFTEFTQAVQQCLSQWLLVDLRSAKALFIS